MCIFVNEKQYFCPINTQMGAITKKTAIEEYSTSQLTSQTKEKVHMRNYPKLMLFFLFSVVAVASNAQIRGLVFKDYNANGLRDSSATLFEPRVAGITIKVYDSLDALLASTTSLANGTYSFTSGQVGTGRALRVEFTGLPFFMYQGASGGTSVQFVTSGTSTAATTVNYGMNNPDDFCHNNPLVIVPRNFVGPKSVTGKSLEGVYYNTAGGTAGSPEPTQQQLADNSLTGATWGLAYSRKNKMIYNSAVVRNYMGTGAGGFDAIYAFNFSDANDDAAPVPTNTIADTIDLSGLGVAVGPDPRGTTFQPTVSSGIVTDSANLYRKVGKTGIGDIDVNSAGDTLYVVNMRDGAPTLAIINISSKTNPSLIADVAMPNPGCTNGIFRPWAVKYYEGRVYIGGVCDASTGTASNLSAYVYRYNGGTSFTQVANTALNYSRGHATFRTTAGAVQSANWRPWTNTWAPTTLSLGPDLAAQPQPILSDIEFLDDGSMVLGFSDRFSFQTAYAQRQYGVTTGSTYFSTIAAGDILKLCNVSGSWVIEGGGSCSRSNTDNGSVASANLITPAVSEFFDDDFYNTGSSSNGNAGHSESALGALAVKAGTKEIMATHFDPITTTSNGGTSGPVNTSGIRTYNNSGNYVKGWVTVADGEPGMNRKGGSLGDIEILCNPAPIEIGNRVWNDKNRNGIQDANELGIAGVVLELITSAGSSVDSDPSTTGVQATFVTTDSKGNYILTSALGTDVTGKNYGVDLLPKTNYKIRVAGSGTGSDWVSGNSSGTGDLAGLVPTKLNATGAGVSDWSDNDASFDGGLPAISFTTGSIGQNNHTLDFGFNKPVGSLGNYVWYDMNGDGLQNEPDSTGINGKKIYLYDGITNLLIDSTTTANDSFGKPGYYIFRNLNSGSYVVKFPTLMGVAKLTSQTTTAGINGNSDANISTGKSPVVVLDVTLSGVSKDNMTIDAGYWPVGSLGNYVWYDDNGDGLQNEPVANGINGQKVYLLNGSTNAVIDSTTTANDPISGNPGYYLFKNLNTGNYKVKFPISVASNNLSTQTTTAATDGNSDANTTTGISPNVFINALGTGTAKDNMTIDAGYLPVGSLGNYVWEDTNKDGFNNESSSLGINGVKVYLKNNSTGLIIDSTTTANNSGNPGYYLFSNLKKGDYVVIFPKVVSSLDLTTQTSTPATDNVSDASILTGESPVVSLDPKLGGISKTNLTIDAGYITPTVSTYGSLGNYLWYDDDGDGTQNEASSNGINGIKVYLQKETSPGSGTYAIVDSTITANNSLTSAPGYYLFDSLTTANYKVKFPLKANGFGLTPIFNQTSTLNDNSDANSSGLSGVVAINTAGTGVQVDNPNIDAGYLPIGTLGNQVWKDDNKDGTFNESSSNGINGVKVYLKNNTTGLIIDSTITANNPVGGNPGYYLFDSLRKGSYVVIFPTSTSSGKLTIQGTSNVDNTSKPVSSTGITAVISMDPKLGGIDKDNLRIDAGYAPIGSLGNYVWMDNNRNGLRDESASTGVNGVKVYLYDVISALVIDSAVTADSSGVTTKPGYYTFKNLSSGSYQVIFPKKLITGSVLTPVVNFSTITDYNNDVEAASGKSDTVVINAASTGLSKDNPTIDAGYWLPASIGNRVFLDANKDGLQSVGELGVANVTVTLFDDNYLIVGSSITDAYGNYKFENLIPGKYAVTFTPPVNYVITKYDPAGDNYDDNNSDADTAFGFFYGTTPLYTLTSGEYDSTVDCGIYLAKPITAVVGDYVWFDENKNGTQETTEKGISGVSVSLINNTGKIVASTTTDANGKYLFTNVPTGNNYSVQFGQPIGYEPTVQSGSIGNSTNSDINPLTLKTSNFNVLPGDSIPTIDAGFYLADPLKAALGDRVWYDNNSNGLQDAGETGVQNVTVYLKNGSGAIIDSTTTDALGAYIFNNLNAGTYSVLFKSASLPSGYSFTGQNLGTNDNIDGDENSSGQTGNYTLKDGERNMSVDAGVVNSSNNNSLGDKVWLDANKDGIQNTTEIGVSGITVTLYNNAGVSITSTTTDANGNYRFNALPNGTYAVGFSNLPVGMGFTSSNAGTNDSLDSDVNTSSGKTPNVTLTGGQYNPTLDAGIYPQGTPSFTGSIGDVVWYDLNNNGKQETGEVGVSDVVAILYDAGKDGIRNTSDDGPSKYMYTDVQGNYLFPNLPPSNYIVAFTALPIGYSTSPQNNTNSREDSDVPGGVSITALTDTIYAPVVALGSGEDNLTIDAGIYKATVNSIGNFVWYDVNKNGIQDVNEKGVFGTEVLLLNPDGTFYDKDPLTTGIQPYIEVTYNDGSYLFTNLPNGSYKVQIANLDAGFQLTTHNAGTNDSFDSDGDPLTFTTQVVTVTGGQFNNTLDFGIYSDVRSALGDYVWIDADKDGLQDAGELPVAGVLVTLYNSSGNPISTTVTDANGKYLFNNLFAGNYTVGFTNLPYGTTFTLQDVNLTTGSDVDPSTGKSNTIALPPGVVNLTVDAGIIPVEKGGLGNYVWYDNNLDGVQDNTELGVTGVTVTLTEASSGDVVGIASTSGTGYYLFPNLDPNKQYIATFSSLPLDYTFTVQNGAITGTTNSDANILTGKTSSATVPVNNINPNVDAGIIIQYGSIGNYTWLDANTNGLQDEPNTSGINGLKVYLLNSIGTVIDSTLTVNDAFGKPGFYLFDSLRSGNYTVKFPVTAFGNNATVQTTTSQTDGNSDANTTTGISPTVTIVSTGTGQDKDNTTIDAGYVAFGAIGNYVWYDKNKNGIQDSIKNPWTGVVTGPELPVPNVIVELYTSDDLLIGKDTTNSVGHYSFDKIPVGYYYVKFINNSFPSNYKVTKKNKGTNDSFDSDVDTLTFRTDTTYISANEIDYRWDLGIYKKVTLEILDPCRCFDIEYKAGEIKQAYEVVELKAEPNDIWIILAQTGMQKLDSLSGPNVPIPLRDTIHETSTGSGIYDLPFLFPMGGSYSILVSNGYDTLAHSNVCYGTRSGNINLTDTLTCNMPTISTLTGSATRVDATGVYPAAGTFVYYYKTAGNVINYITQFNKSLFGSDTSVTLYARFTPTNNALCPLLFSKPVYIKKCPNGTIGNFVWQDANRNGKQDVGETGIAGVKLLLLDSNNVVKATRITTSTGAYNFSGLTPGKYKVKVDSLPTGYMITRKDVGGNTVASDTADNDVDKITKRTPVVVINPGDSIPTLDIGIAPISLSAIGSIVWYDNDIDGVKDGSEPYFSGAKVYLIDTITNTIVDSTITNPGGYYLFDSLPPGGYKVRVSAPGYKPTYSNIYGNAFDTYDSDVDETSGLTSVYRLNGTLDSNLTVWAGLVPAAIPLNVATVQLKSNIIRNKTTLTWTTANPELVQYFNVYRKYENSNKWEFIKTIEIDANSSKIEMVDYLPLNKFGSYSYKLESNFKNGSQQNNFTTVEFSENGMQGFEIYPNPTSKNCVIQSTYNTELGFKADIYTESGMLVDSKFTKSNTLNLDVTNLSSGIYLIKIVENNTTYFKKLMVNH